MVRSSDWYWWIWQDVGVRWIPRVPVIGPAMVLAFGVLAVATGIMAASAAIVLISIAGVTAGVAALADRYRARR